MEAVLDDYRTAPIPEREKALWAFLEKVSLESNRTTQADVDGLRTARGYLPPE